MSSVSSSFIAYERKEHVPQPPSGIQPVFPHEWSSPEEADYKIYFQVRTQMRDAYNKLQNKIFPELPNGMRTYNAEIWQKDPNLKNEISEYFKLAFREVDLMFANAIKELKEKNPNWTPSELVWMLTCQSTYKGMHNYGFAQTQGFADMYQLLRMRCPEHKQAYFTPGTEEYERRAQYHAIRKHYDDLGLFDNVSVPHDLDLREYQATFEGCLDAHKRLLRCDLGTS